MEQLGFDPEKFTYASRRNPRCECGNNCRVIDVNIKPREVTRATIHRKIPVFGPFDKHDFERPNTCTWCGVQTFYLYKRIICPVLSENDEFYYSDCNDCRSIIDRMYEYWENRHPLFKELSPNDYLKTEVREPIITARSEELRKKLYIEIFALSDLLPKDLRQEIINFQMKIIYKEFRLSADDF